MNRRARRKNSTPASSTCVANASNTIVLKRYGSHSAVRLCNAALIRCHVSCHYCLSLQLFKWAQRELFGEKERKRWALYSRLAWYGPERGIASTNGIEGTAHGSVCLIGDHCWLTISVPSCRRKFGSHRWRSRRYQEDPAVGSACLRDQGHADAAGQRAGDERRRSSREAKGAAWPIIAPIAFGRAEYLFLLGECR